MALVSTMHWRSPPVVSSTMTLGREIKDVEGDLCNSAKTASSMTPTSLVRIVVRMDPMRDECESNWFVTARTKLWRIIELWR